MHITRSLFLLPSILLLSCNKQDGNDIAPRQVPEAVRTSLTARFPSATDLDWEKQGANYEADFEVNTVDYKALLAPDGTFLKYKYDISQSELPAAIKTAIGQAYAGQPLDDVERLHEGNSEASLYQIELDKPDRHLVYSADGQEQTQAVYWH